MRGQRVVITGMGAVSPYGEGIAPLWQGLKEGRCVLSSLDAKSIRGLECCVAGRVPELETACIPREIRRAMSPMSIFACLAAREALKQAGLDQKKTPRMGVAAGSTLGSPLALHEFFQEFLTTGAVDNVRSTVFFKVMGHTVASNIAMDCGVSGRILAPSAACASGLLGIGLGYESISQGREEIMLCGGADEFHILTAATFDRLGAASHGINPQRASLPFDRKRDGVVVSEGAGIVVLESLDSAQKRGAKPLAEIRGFATHASTEGIAHPSATAMRTCMEEALHDADLRAQDIDCVNAHATATRLGDQAEGLAVESLWGADNVPVNSLKGHLGHTMAASGALESIACVQMLRENLLLPTLNLREPDPDCGRLRHVTKKITWPLLSFVKNSFALGGICASLVLCAWNEKKDLV